MATPSPSQFTDVAEVYDGCAHVRDLEMAESSDTEIWTYAEEHGYTIVSKDSDFVQRSLTFGFPPKVIWLRIGNCSVDESAELLRDRYIRVRYFHESDDAAVLTLP